MKLAGPFVAAIILILSWPSIAFADSPGFSPTKAQTGVCSGAQAGGNGVNIWANQTTPGASGEGSTWGGSDALPSAGEGSATGAPEYWSFYPRIPDSPQQAAGYCYVLVNRAPSCFQTAQPAANPVNEAAYVTPTVTVADVSSFSSRQPSLATEPLGWSVVGLETNMIAGTSTHTVAGQLLGSAAQVRFTPSSFDFTYGDGDSRRSVSPGSPWASQGFPEFSRTSTSHAYSQTGSYQASVLVGFSLEYRWGAGAWMPIDGIVYREAPAQVVLVVDATNVLVQEACQPAKTAPGC